MQTAITGAFPVSLTVTDLWRRLTDSVKTLLRLVCNFSFIITRQINQKGNVEVVQVKFNFKFQENNRMSLLPSIFNSFVFKISWKVRGC